MGWPLAVLDQKDGPFWEKVGSGWPAAVPDRDARAGLRVEAPLGGGCGGCDRHRSNGWHGRAER